MLVDASGENAGITLDDVHDRFNEMTEAADALARHRTGQTLYPFHPPGTDTTGTLPEFPAAPKT